MSSTRGHGQSRPFDRWCLSAVWMTPTEILFITPQWVTSSVKWAMTPLFTVWVSVCQVLAREDVFCEWFDYLKARGGVRRSHRQTMRSAKTYHHPNTCTQMPYRLLSLVWEPQCITNQCSTPGSRLPFSLRCHNAFDWEQNQSGLTTALQSVSAGAWLVRGSQCSPVFWVFGCVWSAQCVKFPFTV